MATTAESEANTCFKIKAGSFSGVTAQYAQHEHSHHGWASHDNRIILIDWKIMKPCTDALEKMLLAFSLRRNKRWILRQKKEFVRGESFERASFPQSKILPS